MEPERLVTGPRCASSARSCELARTGATIRLSRVAVSIPHTHASWPELPCLNQSAARKAASFLRVRGEAQPRLADQLKTADARLGHAARAGHGFRARIRSETRHPAADGNAFFSAAASFTATSRRTFAIAGTSSMKSSPSSTASNAGASTAAGWLDDDSSLRQSSFQGRAAQKHHVPHRQG